MSSFGTGSIDVGGSGSLVPAFSGTTGVTAGSDGLVPGPAVAQQGYVLGAGGDWTTTILGGIALNDNSNRIATTAFVQGVVAAAVLGGNAALSALSDVTFVGLAGGDFIRYDAVAGKWKNVPPSLSDLSDVDLGGLAVGNTLVWDGANFVPGAGGGGGGAATLDDLTDVTIGGAANKHFLVNNGAGQFVNRLISTADLSDAANIALLNAAQTFTGAVKATTRAVNDDSTNLATTAYVAAQIDNDINALNLGTASQSDAGDFLASNASIADLSDVDTIAGIQVGDVLAWSANNRFEFTAPAQTYTDEDARDAVGGALAGGNHAGISFINNDAADTIDATVSLAGFSVGDLSDVDITTNAPVAGEVLKWDGNKFVPASDTGATQEQIEDIVGGMVAGNTETGISVTYADNGAGAGKLDFVVDNTVVGFLGGVQTFTGDKTFTGAVDLTASTATASLQAGGTNNTSLATTSFVQQEITSLNLGTASQSAAGDFLASTSGLDDLSDVTLNAPAVGHFLVHDGNDFKNRVIASSDLSDTANIALLNANQTFTGDVDFTGGAYTADAPANNAVGREIATASFVRNVVAQVGAVSQLDDLADVTIGGVALAQNQVLVYTANNIFENVGFASTQLSDTADLIRNTSSVGDLSDVNVGGVADGNVLTWNAGAGEFRPTAPAQTYTDEEARDAAGTALANGAHTGISFVNNDAGDTIEATVSLAGFSVGDLSDVNLAGAVDGKILKWDNGSFVVADDNQLTDEQVEDLVGAMFTANNAGNTHITFSYDDTDGANDGTITATVSLASTDLTDTANVARLDQVQTFSANATFTADVDLTGAVATALTQPNVDNSNKVATTEYVKNIVAAVGAVASLDDLTDVIVGGAGGVPLAEGQALRYDAASSSFRNTTLSSTDLSDTADLVRAAGANVLSGDLTLFGGVAPAIAPSFTLKSDTNATTFLVDGQTGNTDILGDLSVTGSITCNDLVVNGATTVVNTTNLEVSDSVIALNAGIGAIPNTNDLGLFLDRGSLDPALVFWDEGDDTFKLGTKAAATGADVDFGGVGFNFAPLQVATPVGGSDSNDVATTEWVNSLVGNLSVDDLTDVQIEGVGGAALASGQVLRYDAGSSLFKNTELGLTDLSDVSLGVLGEGQVLRVNGAGVYVNATLAHTDLSDHASYAPLASPNLTGNPTSPTQPAGNNTTRIATTEFVTTAVANFGNTLGTAAQSDAGDFLSSANNLNDLTDTATARANLGLGSAATKEAGTGAGEVLLLTVANTLPAIDGTNLNALGSVTRHNDVEITPLALQAGQTLRYDGANFINTKLASSDLSDTANISLLNAAQTFTGAVRATTQGADDSSTLLATTAFVQQEILNASIGDLSDVAVAGVQAGDMLRWNGADFQNVQPVVAHITDAGSAATKDAGTGAGEVLLLTAANTLPALDGTNLSGVLMEGNNLSDLTDTTAARTNLGLGTISTRNSVEFLQASNNLSDLDNAPTARTNLGLTSTAITPLASLLQAANNLSELADAGAARTNLGLTSTATTLITAILQVANSLSEIAAAGAAAQATARTNLGLGSASTSDTGDFLGAGAGIDDLSDVNLAGIADGNTLIWNAGAGEFQAGAGGAGGGITTEEARDAAGTALANGAHTGASTISFTNDDANDRINLTLEIETADLTDISTSAPLDGQVLRYTTAAGPNQNKYVPVTLGSASLYNVGAVDGEIPVLGTPSLENSNAASELVVYGRVVEVVDYGSVTQTLAGAGGWSLDFNGSGFGDPVVYAAEDYGVLVC